MEGWTTGEIKGHMDDAKCSFLQNEPNEDLWSMDSQDPTILGESADASITRRGSGNYGTTSDSRWLPNGEPRVSSSEFTRTR